MLAQYWKTVVATLTPVFVVVQAAVTDGTVTTAEWVTVVVALVAAVGVWRVPNAPKPAPADRASERPYGV